LGAIKPKGLNKIAKINGDRYLIEEVEKKSCAVEKVQDYLLIGPRKYNIFATQLRSTCSSLLL
jgi:hypothetical protein